MSIITRPRIIQTRDFVGTSDRIDLGSPTSLDDREPFTICAWIKPRTAGEVSGSNRSGAILVKEDGGFVGAWGFQFLTNTDGRTNALAFYKGFNTVQFMERSSGNNLVKLHQWNFVAVTWDGTNAYTGVKFYVNGVETTYQKEVNGGTPKNSDGALSLFIGNKGNSLDRAFDGKIAYLQFFNRILSAAELEKPMFYPGMDRNGLIGAWCFGPSAYDQSGNNNNGTITGTTLSTDAPPIKYAYGMPRGFIVGNVPAGGGGTPGTAEPTTNSVIVNANTISATGAAQVTLTTISVTLNQGSLAGTGQGTTESGQNGLVINQNDLQATGAASVELPSQGVTINQNSPTCAGQGTVDTGTNGVTINANSIQGAGGASIQLDPATVTINLNTVTATANGASTAPTTPNQVTITANDLTATGAASVTLTPATITLNQGTASATGGASTTPDSQGVQINTGTLTAAGAASISIPKVNSVTMNAPGGEAAGSANSEPGASQVTINQGSISATGRASISLEPVSVTINAQNVDATGAGNAEWQVVVLSGPIDRSRTLLGTITQSKVLGGTIRKSIALNGEIEYEGE